MNFIFWSAGCSLSRAQGFSCSLDVLFEGLGISKLQFLIKKALKINFLLYFFSHFLVIKTLDPDLDSHQMLDPYPDPDSLNPDPQHWSILWLNSVYPRYVCMYIVHMEEPWPLNKASLIMLAVDTLATCSQLLYPATRNYFQLHAVRMSKEFPHLA